jgi:hypothetical protein
MFAILKYSPRVQDQNIMDDIFLTCVAIYNQRFVQTGGDEPWEAMRREYTDLHSADTGAEADVFTRMRELHSHIPEGQVGIASLPEGYVIAQEQETVDTEIQTDYAVRRQQLIDHFEYLHTHQMIRWPSRGGPSTVYRNNQRGET